ncbi:hypothetical protein [Bacillus massiliglaciei]|uniref:hypothetical protein n=1 Tax=Bacillus massiliglaciei TaxID=1816693 RepID=UPI0018FEC9FC|nr:hypothetical protein [Bacillus massiliglaciei]
MMENVSMKVIPSFYDEECAIVFSFSFSEEANKIGEAVIYTCNDTKYTGPDQSALYSAPSSCEKIAYIKKFSIMDEYKALTMKKIQHFMNIIGIQRCISDVYGKEFGQVN